jgi:hypothetical protein
MSGWAKVLVGVLLTAGLAVALGTLAHDGLGISRADIRSNALLSAAVLAMVCAASCLRPPEP